MAQSSRISRTLTTVVVSGTMVEERALMVRMRRPRVGGTKAPPPKIHNLCTRPFPPASLSYEGDGLTSREEGTATCTEDYEAKSRVIASTTRTYRLDGCTSANTGWPFSIGVTTTVLPCFASTLAQNGRLGAPECTNSTISGTCVMGCTTDPERAPGDNLRTPPSVSENDGVTFLGGRGREVLSSLRAA